MIAFLDLNIKVTIRLNIEEIKFIQLHVNALDSEATRGFTIDLLKEFSQQDKLSGQRIRKNSYAISY
ncbi:MAG TPA: hypothetical protein DIW35_00545 [Psychrobacter sp.]|jgi:hypothetical protein|nr:hypothetical protein [Psychrobacter sp.]